MSSHLSPGTLLQNGKYRIVRFIKSGGFGCTYEAENTYFEERVAIKEFFVKGFCNRDESTSHITVGTQSMKELVGKLKSKFIAEAKALYKLKHPGIVHVSDVFEENGTAYYVMEYIDGCSLDVYLQQRGPLPEADALDYICQVCDALKYVHAQNRLHLDIKPGNIMLAKDSGKAILVDFGSAKQYDECSGENTSTLLGSTPGYAPPEQTNTRITQFFPATDIYALGATLYKLLTGITPLTANERSSGEQLEPLPETVSRPTCNAIEQAMLLKKRDRPQDVDAFLALLDDAPQPVVEKEEAGDEDEKTIPFYEEEDKTVPMHSPVHEIEEQPKKRARWIWWTLAGIVAVCIGVFAAMRCLGGVSLPSGFHSGHAYVDLGLPSGTKWATCNAGAFIPSGGGNVFTWTDAGAVVEEWGGDWRLPTENDFEELLDEDNCTWARTTIGFRKGYKVTSKKNGNSIFLPENKGTGRGYYWSSTQDIYDHVYVLNINCDWHAVHSDSYYDIAKFRVRPVFK